jgi:amidophosphoribosyltransferase
MCGIAGIFGKTPEVRAQLGAHLTEMLLELESRGPDSAGVALYRDPVADGGSKLSLLADAPADWAALAATIAAQTGVQATMRGAGHGALLTIDMPAEDATAHVRDALPGIRVIASGRSIEMFKQTGAPSALANRIGLTGLDAGHAIAHTRMATESKVSIDGSHPFSTGPDLCLVHNGSLSNHNRLRIELKRHGITFDTLNDSEVAAGYLTHRMNEGDSLHEALEAALDDLDGFFTFAVGTADGFAVLRDPVACKPAVLAETDDWVAVASEYRAIATLPGADTAHVWEPEPAHVYSWDREAVAA